jgi:cob(I)alamin adenosyltransferase
MKLEKGLIQIYTGPGKGKTTAAIGLAARAASKGLQVSFLQFLKACHDEAAITQIPTVYHRQFGVDHSHYGWLQKTPAGQVPTQEQQKHLNILTKCVNEGWQIAQNLIQKGESDLVILDELNMAIYFDLLPTQKIIDAIQRKPDHVEIVITGRNAPEELLEIADLVTYMDEKKHPYQKGILAREGIEY